MDRQQPKSLRRTLPSLVLLLFAVGVNVWGLESGRPEPPSEPVAAVCRPVPVGAMQNRACLGREPKVVIWGDSMAHAWVPMAQTLGVRLNLPSTNLARDGCPPLPGAKLSLRSQQESVDCARWNEDAIAYLRGHGADTLVIVARWRNFIRVGLDNGAAEAIGRAVAQASPHVRRILLVSPTPEFANHAESVARADFESDCAEASVVLRRLASNPKVRLVEPAAWLCDGDTCPIQRAGSRLYSDRWHVSTEAAMDFGAIVAKGEVPDPVADTLR